MANSAKNHQSNLDAALFSLSLDRGAGLAGQLLAALRETILDGAHAGCRLPASRVLAAELSVSRLTVTTVYDQLTAEGYLTARPGAGTFVAQDLPHLAPPPATAPPPPPRPRPILPFRHGSLDQGLFPHRLWARHLERAWRAPEPALLGRADPFGWAGLRQAIAEHLAVWRGISCEAGQIVITAGARDCVDILAQALLPRGAAVAVEDPGWPVLHDLFTLAGSRPLPLRIDAEGLDPATLPLAARAVLVTPSRHYPTGVAMPLARRLALLAWARQADGLVLEDDYDSEFRYRGQPLPALAGIDGLQRVLYAGSFSKLLSPSLRIGYLVLPERLVGRVQDHLRRTGPRASLLPQPALARFMASGEFATHLRRMRRIHAARQAALLAALQPLAGLLTLAPDPGGMHLTLPVRPGLTDRALAAAAGTLAVDTLSDHCRLPDPPQALILGYTAFDEATLRAAAAALVARLAPFTA